MTICNSCPTPNVLIVVLPLVDSCKLSKLDKSWSTNSLRKISRTAKKTPPGTLVGTNFLDSTWTGKCLHQLPVERWAICYHQKCGSSYLHNFVTMSYSQNRLKTLNHLQGGLILLANATVTFMVAPFCGDDELPLSHLWRFRSLDFQETTANAIKTLNNLKTKAKCDSLQVSATSLHNSCTEFWNAAPFK